MNTTELCQAAGRDPDEQITRFTMEDFANTVLEIEDFTDEQRIAILAAVDLSDVANSLCDASGWGDIFAQCALVTLEQEAK